MESMKAIGWKYYHARLAGRDMPMHPAFVPIGFYRLVDQRKRQAWPVAVWIDSADTKYARVGQAEIIVFSTPAIEEDFSFNTFSRTNGEAITHETYLYWMEHRAWPAKQGAEAALEASLPADNPRAAIGDNSGDGAASDHEIFADQVRSALAGVKDLKTVTSEEQASTANSLRNRLTELASEGGKKHEVEKKPHLDAGRAVDERWNPLIKEARAGASTLRTAIEAHKTAMLREQREREAAQAAASNPVTTAAPVDKIESAYGKNTSVKAVLVPQIVDQDEVYQQLRGNPEVVTLLEKLVRKVYAAGGALKGVTTTERASIR